MMETETAEKRQIYRTIRMAETEMQDGVDCSR